MQDIIKTIAEMLQQKNVRIALGVLCTLMALSDLFTFVKMDPKTQLGFFRGIGGLVLWGAWGVKNFAHAYKREIPYLRFVINVGIALVLTAIFLQMQ